MTKASAANKASLSDEAFAEFLARQTSAEILKSTVSSDWSGVHAQSVEQGNESFESPALENHFVALCTDGFGVADISFDALNGPTRSTAEPGTLCFMPAGQAAKMAMAGRATSTHIFLKPDVFNCVMQEKAKGHSGLELEGFAGRFQHQILNTVQRIEQGWETNSTVWADTVGLELAEQILRYVSDVDPDTGARFDLSNLQFCRAIDYIEANLPWDFTLEDMAKAIEVDIYRLAKGFETEADCTIEQFCAERRVGIAADVLRKADDTLNLAQLARHIGFKGVEALDAAFRANMGISAANFQAGRVI